ncbi:MAG: CHAT domain-containing protein [Bacteroidales bacterium]|nr:CHAT domain-containing protein [Bacteroidales bacterium]
MNPKFGYYISKLIFLVFCTIIFPCEIDGQDIKDITSDYYLMDSAQLYENLGWDNYLKGNYELSEQLYLRALNLYKVMLGEKDIILGNLYLNIGVQYKNQWDIDNALLYYRKAQLVYNENNSLKHLAKVTINIGNILKNKGDYKNAEEYYVNSISLLKSMPVIDYKVLSSVYNSLGMLNNELKKYKEAISFYKESISLKRLYDEKSISIPLLNLAICYANIENYDKALEMNNQAINKTLEIYGDKHISLGRNYLFNGELLLKLKNEDKALIYLNKALDLYRMPNGMYHPEAYECFTIMAGFRITNGDYLQAIKDYQSAIIILTEQFNNVDIYVYPEISDAYSKIKLLEVLKLKAVALYQYSRSGGGVHDLEASFEGFELTLKLIDKIRLEYLSEESKLILAEHQTETFSWALKVTYEIWEQTNNDFYKDRLFSIAEKGKSAVLMDALRHNEAKEIGGVPPELLKQEEDINRSIAFYSEYLHEEKRQRNPDTVKINLWEQKLFALNRDYEELIRIFNTKYPEYYQLKYNINDVSVSDLQRNLNRDLAVIEYALDDSLLYTFLITKKSYEVHCIRVDSNFYQQMVILFRHVSNTEFNNTNGEDFYQYVTAALSLYDILLLPFKDAIGVKKLVIIPDKELSYMPFELLLCDNSNIPKTLDYRSLPYLIRGNTVSYAFSVTHLLDRERETLNNENKLLAFVPEYSNSQLAASTFRSYRADYLDKLNPLPFAKQEVDRISNIIRGTNVFVGNQATETNFKVNAKSYKILHLAMHTILNDENPMFSKLVFEPHTDSLNDGFLNTFEIYNLNLNAYLVVLSSCSSGSGKLRKGEGLMSLARGFAFAGCPGIVMTLWEVDDEAGVSIMSSFYKYLKKGNPIDDALRYAKLEYLDKADIPHSHPFLWASYVDIGKTTPVFSIISPRWPLLYILVLLILIGFGITVNIRKKWNDKKSLTS